MSCHPDKQCSPSSLLTHQTAPPHHAPPSPCPRPRHASPAAPRTGCTRFAPPRTPESRHPAVAITANATHTHTHTLSKGMPPQHALHMTDLLRRMHTGAMPHQHLDALCMATISCDPCRCRAVLRSSNTSLRRPSPPPRRAAHTHHHRLVHFCTVPCQHLNAVYVTISGSHVRRSRTVLLGTPLSDHTLWAARSWRTPTSLALLTSAPWRISASRHAAWPCSAAIHAALVPS